MCPRSIMAMRAPIAPNGDARRTVLSPPSRMQCRNMTPSMAVGVELVDRMRANKNGDERPMCLEQSHAGNLPAIRTRTIIGVSSDQMKNGTNTRNLGSASVNHFLLSTPIPSDQPTVIIFSTFFKCPTIRGRECDERAGFFGFFLLLPVSPFPTGVQGFVTTWSSIVETGELRPYPHCGRVEYLDIPHGALTPLIGASSSGDCLIAGRTVR